MRRRRFIKIMATSVAGLSLGQSLRASSLVPVSWQGYALGSEGQFTLYTETPGETKVVLDRCLAEIRRLESLFSLYDDQSELSKLNRQGRLQNPSAEWQPLLNAVDNAHNLTHGLFDPTVQPFWRAYHAHFEKHSNSEFELDSDTLSKVGWHKVHHDTSEIQFAESGMSLTLNGIAQGFITDLVTEILRDAGYTQVLVELGETRALGLHPEQRPWQIGIKDAHKPAQIREVAELDNQALATSGGYGSTFSKDGSYHHLIHPRNGRPTDQWKSLSVIAPTATQADALSTGLSFANSEIISKVRAHNPELNIITQS